jgi:flagellar biosynthetic protein FliP
MKFWIKRVSWAAPFLLLTASPALAQSLTLNMGDSGSSTGHIVQLVMLLTVLSLAPAVLITVTSFTRIVVVLSFLRNALGTQSTPPNIVMISLALFLTGFVMAPTLQTSYDNGIAPLIADKITEQQASTAPPRRSMIS